MTKPTTDAALDAADRIIALLAGDAPNHVLSAELDAILVDAQSASPAGTAQLDVAERAAVDRVLARHGYPEVTR